MIITHASSQKIESVKPAFHHLLGCLHFAGEGNTYNMAGDCAYQYNIEVDNVVRATRFWYEIDEECEKAVAVIEALSAAIDVDAEQAYQLLEESLFTHEMPEFELDNGEAGWVVQQYQGILANEFGFDCCESFDEQGTLYIAYCVDREMEEVKCE